jgi:hypothetical protein
MDAVLDSADVEDLVVVEGAEVDAMVSAAAGGGRRRSRVFVGARFC